MNHQQILETDPPGGEETWSVDADASLQSVLDRPDTSPLLRQTLTGALSWQARNSRSVRTALASPRSAPQWVAALLALGATAVIVAEAEAETEAGKENDSGPQEVPLEAVMQRRIRGRVSALRVRMGEKKWGQARVARTPADEPIVAAVAAVEMQGDVVHQARVALTGVWPEPVRLAQAATRLVGQPLDEHSIQAVAEAVEQEVAPEADFLGSEEYRRAMAGVLTRRALAACRSQHQETINE